MTARFRAVRASGGFTAIELVLGLVIVGLLVTVAVVSFFDHMERKALAQARSALVELAEGLRMQHTRTGSFELASLPITQTPREGDADYLISLARTPMAATDPTIVFPASTAQEFTLQAVPVGESACGTLLLDHAGRVGVTAPGAKLADCWSR